MIDAQNIMYIGPLQLFLCLGFVLLAGVTSLWNKLHLGKDLLVGSLRTFAQLFLMGYVLRYIFDIQNIWLVLILFIFMVAAAVRIIVDRVKEQNIAYTLPTFVSMLLSYLVITYIVTAIIIQAAPWWTPQYFIPLAGMIIGNSMTAISLALERLFSDLRNKRDEVEMKLAVGADYKEASQEIVRDSIRAGMIPSINSLMSVGLVSLPGMMTGQILAGAEPLIAIRYQIVVMLMIVAATSLGSLIVIKLVCRRCFSTTQHLLLR